MILPRRNFTSVTDLYKYLITAYRVSDYRVPQDLDPSLSDDTTYVFTQTNAPLEKVSLNLTEGRIEVSCFHYASDEPVLMGDKSRTYWQLNVKRAWGLLPETLVLQIPEGTYEFSGLLHEDLRRDFWMQTAQCIGAEIYTFTYVLVGLKIHYAGYTWLCDFNPKGPLDNISVPQAPESLVDDKLNFKTLKKLEDFQDSMRQIRHKLELVQRMVLS